MIKNSFALFALTIGLTLCFQNISAQVTINLPKIPKIKKVISKPAPAPVTSDTQTASNNQSASVPDQSGANRPEQTKEDVCEDLAVRIFSEDAEKQQEDIESFKPGRGWFVRGMNYSPLIYAVSPKARQERYNDVRMQQFLKCPRLSSAYDKLAELASQKLPQYMPNKTEYAPATPAVEKLLKSGIKDLSDHKVYYAGVREANWLIEKNRLGIPTARYKHALVWVRHTPDDHPYCWIYFINLVQDYSGGGTYGATYANPVKYDLAGCPAGK